MCLVSEPINPDTVDVRNKCIFVKINVDASQRGIRTQPLQPAFAWQILGIIGHVAEITLH